DKSFNKTGIQKTDFGSEDNQAIAVTIDKNDKIIVAGFANKNGHFDFALARFNTNGTLDNSFGTGGLQTTDFGNTDDFCQSIIVQPNGKIIAAGYNYNYLSQDFKIAVARYNEDGSTDKSFGSNGRLNSESGFAVPNGAAIQNDGKLVMIAKPADYVLLRYNTNGTLDDTFGTNGNVEMDFSLFEFNDLVIQNDQKILIAGHGPFFNSDFLLARFTASGKVDKSFSGDGHLLTDFGSSSDFLSSIVVQRDGKIIAGGVTQNSENINSIALSRYNSEGVPDKQFGKSGRLTDQFRQGLTTYNTSVLQADGKLIAAGSVWNGIDFDFVIARYDTKGNLDNTFNVKGYQTIDFKSNNDYINSITIQKDGKIVAAGYSGTNTNSGFAIARINTDGSIDKSFDKDGKTTTHFNGNVDIAYGVSLQKDDKIIVTGSSQLEFNEETNRYSSDFIIARYNADGTMDNSFAFDGFLNIDLGGDDIPKAIAIDQDDNIVVGGYSQIFDGADIERSYFAIIRLTPGGFLDETFSGDGIELDGFSGLAAANAIALQGDGKILATGIITNKDPNEKILTAVRYNKDGSFDNTFNGLGLKTISTSDGDLTTNAITLQKNGKIIIAGSLNNDAALWRLNSDGSIDKSFDDDGVLINSEFTTNDRIQSISFSENKFYTAGVDQISGNVGVITSYLLADLNTSPPTIVLSAPADNASFISPVKTLSLKASASDADGVITKVDFYSGEILLHTETEAPYGFTWLNVPAGKYTLTAVATDNSGLSTTSLPIQISVEHNKVPVISFIKPVANETYTSKATIQMEVDANDPDGRITKVEFYNGNVLLHTEYKKPFTFTWEKVSKGNYTITAKAFDNWGATTSTSTNIIVERNKAPEVSIISPLPNKTFLAKAIIPLEANAKDVDGRIVRVEFFDGSILIRKEFAAPYSYQWVNAAVGVHIVTAVAVDNYGQKTISAPITIVVVQPLISRNSWGRVLGAQHNQPEETVVLNPNPANSFINISGLVLTNRRVISLTIFSLSGKNVKEVRLPAAGNKIQLDVSRLKSGTYTAQIKDGDTIINKQFIKL
ncbi:MAG: Ig-like domain-containing protein, partial [Ginsengibacter sp.]